MVDLKKSPADLPGSMSSAEALRKCAESTSLYFDSLQTRVDLTLWPDLLENCFSFVANTQMLSTHPESEMPPAELAHFIRTNAAICRNIEYELTEIASTKDA